MKVQSAFTIDSHCDNKFICAVGLSPYMLYIHFFLLTLHVRV